MVVTNNDALYDLVGRLRGQGVSRTRTYWHDILGYNYRMTNIAAAIGLAQLKRVDETLKRKREIADQYKDRLASVRGVVLQSEPSWARNVYWMFSILVPAEKRKRLCDYLDRHGVETRPFFYPAHKMPVYTEYHKQEFPVAQMLATRGINLPSGPTVTDDEIHYVCSVVKRFLSKH